MTTAPMAPSGRRNAKSRVAAHHLACVVGSAGSTAGAWSIGEVIAMCPLFDLTGVASDALYEVDRRGDCHRPLFDRTGVASDALCEVAAHLLIYR
jgi:hypothetical protein